MSYAKFRKEIEITNLIKTVRILKAGLQSKFTPTEWKMMKDEAAYKRVWYFDNAQANNAIEDVDYKGLGLTVQQVDTFRMAFKLFDADGDNTISTSEIGAIVRQLGKNPSDQEL